MGGGGGELTAGTGALSGGAGATTSSSAGSGGVPTASTGGSGGQGAASGGAAGTGVVTGGGGGTGAGGSGGMGTAGAGATSMIDAFNGDCTKARWANVSQTCWSCMCSACASTMNLANRKSMEIFECMVQKKLLVNQLVELTCEQRAGLKDCVNGATTEWNNLVTFDLCLMSAPNKTTFRACDTECGTPYPGDVCTRYP